MSYLWNRFNGILTMDKQTTLRIQVYLKYNNSIFDVTIAKYDLNYLGLISFTRIR